MPVSIYYKLSLFNAHAMILIFHIFMNVNTFCLNQSVRLHQGGDLELTNSAADFQWNKDAKICLAAPSNAAADELLRRLSRRKSSIDIDCE